MQKSSHLPIKYGLKMRIKKSQNKYNIKQDNLFQMFNLTCICDESIKWGNTLQC